MRRQDPKHYLSTSEGKWRVIHGGVPICPDTDEASARHCARFAGCDISHRRIWDGDKGEWIDE